MKIRTCTPPYPEKFKPGDIAISKENVDFTDGTKHKSGQRIKVTLDNVSYYNVNHKYYDRSEP